MKKIDFSGLSNRNREKAEGVIKVIGDALELYGTAGESDIRLMAPELDFDVHIDEVYTILKNFVGEGIIFMNDDFAESRDRTFYIRDKEAIIEAWKEVNNRHQKSSQTKSAGTDEPLITQKAGAFFYKNKEMNLQERFDYVKAFKVLFENVDNQGFCSYEDLRDAYNKKYPKDYKKRPATQADFNIWLQKKLTEKGNGFTRKLGGEVLIKAERGDGLRFKNRIS